MSCQFVTEFKDRHGKTRYRFRRAGFDAYLPSPNSGDFAAEYAKMLAKAPLTPIRRPRSAVGKLRSILREREWCGDGEFVYFIQMRGMVKVGYSSRIADRISKLTAQHPTPIRLLAVMRGGRDVEAKVHSELSAHRIKGEWFSLSSDVRRMVAFARNGGTFVNNV